MGSMIRRICQGVAYVHTYIIQHMPILAAAEDRAEDMAALHVDPHAIHIGPLVEEHALVALAGAEEVARHRVGNNRVDSAWHSDCSATHLHSTGAYDVGLLVATIHRGEDMSASNLHMSVAIHLAGSATPHSGGYRIESRAAAKHIAKERAACGADRITGIVSRMIGINVGMSGFVRQVVENFIYFRSGIIIVIVNAVRPCITFVENIMQCAAIGKCGANGFILYGSNGSLPLLLSVNRVKSTLPNPIIHRFRHKSRTYLAAHNLHMGVSQHQSVLASTIYRGGDEWCGGCRHHARFGVSCRSVLYLQIGAAYHARCNGFVISNGICLAFSAAENPSAVVIVGIGTGNRHQ